MQKHLRIQFYSAIATSDIITTNVHFYRSLEFLIQVIIKKLLHRRYLHTYKEKIVPTFLVSTYVYNL